MKPPLLDRLREEDMPKAPDWFKQRVMYILNRFMETVVQIFTKNLNFADNFDSQVHKDTINASALTSGYKIRVTMKAKPEEVRIQKLVKTTEAYTAFTEAPFPLWEYQDGEKGRFIVIHNILGIDSTSDYNVTLLII
jgi:hypothetical protein